MMSSKLINRSYQSIVAIALIISACSEESPEIGSGFVNDISLELIQWDTVTFDMQTILYDSVVTSYPDRLLAGSYDHPELGIINAQPYFQVAPVSSAEIEYESISGLTYKSTSLVLYYDGYSYGDTVSTLDLSVHLVSQEIELDEENQLYNFSELELEQNDEGTTWVLGSSEFIPRPYSGDSVEILLDDSFGQELFEYILDQEPVRSDFLDSIRGFSVSTADQQAILGFTTSPVLRIYYTDDANLTDEEEVFSISTEATDVKFNHISAERTETYLSDLEFEGVSSEYSDNSSYVQSGLGLAVRIEMPYLSHFQLIDTDDFIDNVQLELGYRNEIPDELPMLEDGLILYEVDGDNEIIASYDAAMTLVADDEFAFEQTITIDITDFVQDQISNNGAETDHALMIRFYDSQYKNSLDHLILTDQSSDEIASRVILNIITIDQ